MQRSSARATTAVVVPFPLFQQQAVAPLQQATVVPGWWSSTAATRAPAQSVEELSGNPRQGKWGRVQLHHDFVDENERIVHVANSRAMIRRGEAGRSPAKPLRWLLPSKSPDLGCMRCNHHPSWDFLGFLGHFSLSCPPNPCLASHRRRTAHAMHHPRPARSPAGSGPRPPMWLKAGEGGLV